MRPEGPAQRAARATGDVDGRTRGSFIGGWIPGGFLEGPSCRPRPTGQSVTTLRDHRRAALGAAHAYLGAMFHLGVVTHAFARLCAFAADLGAGTADHGGHADRKSTRLNSSH